MTASDLIQSSHSQVLLPTAAQNQAETRAAQLLSEVTLMVWLQIQLSGKWLPEFQMAGKQEGSTPCLKPSNGYNPKTYDNQFSSAVCKDIAPRQ